METFSALLAVCEGNSPVTGEFPSQRPVTRRFDVFFDLHLNKRLNKPSRGRWFETPSSSLWRHGNIFLPAFQARNQTGVAHENIRQYILRHLIVTASDRIEYVRRADTGWKWAHEDVTTGESFPHCWPFVRRIHQSSVGTLSHNIQANHKYSCD